MSRPDPASSKSGTPSDAGADPNAPDLVVVANRLPVDLVVDEDGGHRWQASPGGLVTALEPTLRARRGAWVGWPGAPDVEPEPFERDGLRIHPVALSSDEVAEHYEGLANATLWPLYHDAVAEPVFDRTWWRTHQRVNENFAAATAAVAAHGATVWVQDYQLQLVPRMLRERRPDLMIGFFLHIPFPPPEIFVRLPWRTEVVDGLLGADLVGFQTPGAAENFRRVAGRLRGTKADDRPVVVGEPARVTTVDGRTVTAGAYPISVDSPTLDRRAADDDVAERARTLRRDLGDPRTVLLGVDRLDYTKGIDVRLSALSELLDAGRLDARDTVLVQVATPSREKVEHYQRMRDDIELEVGRVNGAHAAIGRPVVHYLHQSLPQEDLLAFYRAADVMLVTPFRDGMNLVAKEYVAARHDGGGALVLSEFAGAAEELAEGAYLVNPYDLDGVQRRIVEAATAAPDEARRRMGLLRDQVLAHDVTAWSRAFLTDLGVDPDA